MSRVDGKTVRVALVGNPNCGKTALFNALTGSKQKVGNYPGVTVERKLGVVRLLDRRGDVREFEILDLPGIYSLEPKSPDEGITVDVLLGQNKTDSRPDVVLAVADATALDRSLALMLELRALGIPMVMALNMMDLAQGRGLELDLDLLERELGFPVVPTVAVRTDGLDVVLDKVWVTFESDGKPADPAVGKEPGRVAKTETVASDGGDRTIESRFAWIDQVLSKAVRMPLAPAKTTELIDRVVLHPFLGPLLLLGVLTLLFQTLFSWASVPQDWIKSGIEMLKGFIQSAVPPGAVQSLLVDGVISGVGAVVVFLPQILLLFLFILLLEDSGYMARAAFLMDRLMSRVGLNGRAFIPLLSSYACAIPGIMATRTIGSHRDRLVTILIAPLTTCSARLPVYTLLVGAFIPDREVLPFLGLRAAVMIGLYGLGIATALIMAVLFKKTLLPGSDSMLLMELPTYKWPSIRSVLLGLLDRAKIFVRRAGTVILSLVVALWFLVTYPKPPEGAPKDRPAVEYSIAGRIGKFMEPALKPIGMDWRIGVALIPGLAAREVMVGALATVYAVESKATPTEGTSGQAGESEASSDALTQVLAKAWGLPTAMSLLIWYVFACQCLSTLAVVRRETQSWKWPAVMMAYMTSLAYAGAAIAYHLTRYLMGVG